MWLSRKFLTDSVEKVMALGFSGVQHGSKGSACAALSTVCNAEGGGGGQAYFYEVFQNSGKILELHTFLS